MNRMAAQDKTKRKIKPTGRKAKGRKSKAAAARSKTDPRLLAVLNPEKLREIYSSMLKCRMLAETMQALSGGRGWRQEYLARGDREAVLVGAAAHLVAEDPIALAHSSFLARFVRGTPLDLILAQLATNGNTPSSREGLKRGSGAAAELSMATGMRLAQDVKGKAKVVLVFPGVVSAAQDFVHDGLALAATHALPLVCLIESSAASDPAPAAVSPAFSGGSPAPHVPRIFVDGVDAVAIFRVAQEAVRRARAGHGPSLIECVLPGKKSEPASRPNDELRDPIAFMEQYLRRRSLWSDEWQRKTAADFARELKRAASARRSEATSYSDHVYSPDVPSARPSSAAALVDRTGPSGA